MFLEKGKGPYKGYIRLHGSLGHGLWACRRGQERHMAADSVNWGSFLYVSL